MKVLAVALVALLCQAALAKKSLDAPVGGRNAETTDDGSIQMQGGSKKTSIGVNGLVELDSQGNEISNTKIEQKKNIVERVISGDTTLPFSDGVQAKCLAVSQTMGNTSVDLQCCIAKETGNVTLGGTISGTEVLEEFTVGAGFMKCTVTVREHNWSTDAGKLCILANVLPPGANRFKVCFKESNKNANKKKEKKPKKCDLGDATLGLSTMAGEYPVGGNVQTDMVWFDLEDGDVGLTTVDNKLVAKFCVPKGNADYIKWYDPTMDMADDVYGGAMESAAKMSTILLTAIAMVVTSVILY